MCVNTSWSDARRRPATSAPIMLGMSMRLDRSSSALISNSSSEVVGFSEDCAFQTVHEFYVKGNGPMVDIESLILGGPEVTPIQPGDISEKGEFFELAAFANGETRTDLLRPTDDRQGDGKNRLSPISASARAAAKIRSGSLDLRRFANLLRHS